MYNNCLVGQSGGPTAVINASVAGVINNAVKSAEIDHVYGVVNGIEGVMQERIFDFDKEDYKELKMLRYTPSSILGSCRYKLKDFNTSDAEYVKIFNVFKKYHIKYFFYIGGNDSMDTVDKLSSYAKATGFEIYIIGIPKTIDNDLNGTDHTPGYGSAAKFIATSVMEIARDGDAYEKDIINIVEVMGRNTGWLAAASALARCDYLGAPDLIYLPETTFDLDEFLSDVSDCYHQKKRITIVVSEGIKNERGDYVFDNKQNSTCLKDSFGHTQMGGTGFILGKIVRDKILRRVKVIELGILQRCAMHFASMTDVDEAYQCGYDAVDYALDGNNGQMVSIKRLSNEPYAILTTLVPIGEVANVEKKIPLDLIDVKNRFVKKEVIDYIKPLIIGEVPINTENGLPRFANLKKRFVEIVR